MVLAVQKVLSGSERAGRLRLMGKYIGHRLVARPELDNTFWTDSTIANKEKKGIFTLAFFYSYYLNEQGKLTIEGQITTIYKILTSHFLFRR